MARLLVARQSFQSIDLGEILRETVSSHPEHPRFSEIRYALTTGNLISDETTVEIVEEVCKRMDQDGLIFDGFPRSISAIRPFKLFLSRMEIPPQFVILCEFTIDQRNIGYLAKDRGRVDDLDQDVLQNRLSNFCFRTEPALAVLKKSYRHIVLPFSSGIENNYSRLVGIIDERKEAV